MEDVATELLCVAIAAAMFVGFFFLLAVVIQPGSPLDRILM